MTPYEKEIFQVVATPGAIVAVPFPGRCEITRVTGVSLSGGAFSVTLYSRAFTTPTVPVRLVRNSYATLAPLTGNQQNVQLVLTGWLAAKVGDVITVAASANAPYNTSHRIVQVIDDLNVVTDQVYSVDDGSASVTAALAIPTAEQPLYQLNAAAITGEDLTVRPYHNLDPASLNCYGGGMNIGVPRLLYVKFANTGTFRMAIRCRVGVAMGD